MVSYAEPRRSNASKLILSINAESIPRIRHKYDVDTNGIHTWSSLLLQQKVSINHKPLELLTHGLLLQLKQPTGY